MINTHAFYSPSQTIRYILFSLFLTLLLAGCSNDDEQGTGYVQLYNLSANSPAINLTIDKYSDDNFEDKTYSGINFTNLGSRLTLDEDTYDISLAWQDEYDTQASLETIYESSLQVKDNSVKLVVVTEDIKAPNVLTYDIPVRTDDEIQDDSNDDVFNIRVLNMDDYTSGVNLYYSQSDETFNEAVLFSQTSYTQLTDNQKIEQNDYIFYLTSSDSDEVLFQSTSISFAYAGDYIMVIRENQGVGSSPFVLDKLSSSTVTKYTDTDSEAQYQVYNGIVQNPLLPEYTGSIDFYINGIDDSPEISSLGFREFSDAFLMGASDYSMSLIDSDNKSVIINNHLLTLDENSDKTIFFYLLEQAVDEDGDGNVDENNDGYIDEKEVTINSLVVENSHNESIYSHQINTINLIDQDEIIDNFSYINVYFVLNDENITDASIALTATFANPTSVTLLNNTYTVYVVGKLDSSEIILSSFEMTLNEDSVDQFLILEKDASTDTGYSATLASQSKN